MASPTLRSTSFLAVLLFVLGCHESAGQGLWTELATIGYGGLGVAAGSAAAAPDENGLIVAGALLGMIVGSRIGGSAESNAEGDPLGRVHLSGLRLGVVAGGGTIGAVVGGLLVRDEDGVGGADSDWAILLGGAVGAATATLYQVVAERRTLRRSPAGAPRLNVRPAPGGGWQVGLRL